MYLYHSLLQIRTKVCHRQFVVYMHWDIFQSETQNDTLMYEYVEAKCNFYV